MVEGIGSVMVSRIVIKGHKSNSRANMSVKIQISRVNENSSINKFKMNTAVKQPSHHPDIKENQSMRLKVDGLHQVKAVQ